ncbi:hypothetical protein INT44_006632 [Umbelopsis vinacea]|uniref:NADH-ubiquinone oxidoreductase 12 kDa subunit n=1 Tax=Umbelopsis vinacea TaxID=44442 RepID=A0A8H7PF14_9FUNG|nr:hypothetical protein INT44_006632 [Umbelopsis vinacea]
MSSSAADWEYPEHRQFERYEHTEIYAKLTTSRLLTIPPFRFASSVYAAREQKIRDDWVKAMEARIIRDQLSKCYKTEGVNHYQNCRELADMYLKAVKENKVEGFRKKPATEA